MIQFAFSVEQNPELSSSDRPASSWRYQRCSDGWLASYRDDNASGRQAVDVLRDWLTEMIAIVGPDVLLRDLFSNRSLPLNVWLEKLQQPGRDIEPLVTSEYCRVGDIDYLMSVGMSYLGKPELLIVFPSGADSQLKTAAETFVLAMARFFSFQNQPLQLQQAYPYGFSLIGFERPDVIDDETQQLIFKGLNLHPQRDVLAQMKVRLPRFVVAIEACDPVAVEPRNFQLGLVQTLTIANEQRRFYAKNALGGDLSANVTDAAIVCNVLESAWQQGRPVAFAAYRESPQSDLDSGWRFVCDDQEHPHDHSTTRVVSLGWVCHYHFEVIQLLASAEGSLVVIENGDVHVLS